MNTKQHGKRIALLISVYALGAVVLLALYASSQSTGHPVDSPAISAYAQQGQVPTPPTVATVEVEPLLPVAYLPDGTSTDVATLLTYINVQRGHLADDPFFAWVHAYLAQTTIRGTMWVRFSDAPMGSVSWLSRDGRPELMLMGCTTPLPLGYHDIVLTTSNVVCLNGECLFMAMPLTVDGR